VSTGWPALPYEAWQPTLDTLHAHTQALGKLAVALAAPEPQLQHAALRLTARGWETGLLPAPDGAGALVAALDLHAHEAVVEHCDGRARRVPLRPDRAAGDVFRAVIAAARELVGPFDVDPRPQETPWTTPLDEDAEHSTYDEGRVADYLAAATHAALVLAEVRAPFRGRSTPVNAWWGSFDLAVNLYSGRPADPPRDDFITRNSMDTEEIAIGWWPGDSRYPHAAFFGYAFPAADGFGDAALPLDGVRWDEPLGLYLLDWDDVRETDDPHRAAVDFARAVVRHACSTCNWDRTLAASLDGDPPPVVY